MTWFYCLDFALSVRVSCRNNFWYFIIKLISATDLLHFEYLRSALFDDYIFHGVNQQYWDQDKTIQNNLSNISICFSFRYLLKNIFETSSTVKFLRKRIIFPYSTLKNLIDQIFIFLTNKIIPHVSYYFIITILFISSFTSFSIIFSIVAIFSVFGNIISFVFKKRALIFYNTSLYF